MTMTKQLLAVFITALFLGAPAVAQEKTGDLRVTVRDPSGAVIRVAGPANAAVAVADVLSDQQGAALAHGLAIGRYKVEISFPGFEPFTLADVRIKPGENRRDVTLQIQKVDETVSVGRDPAIAASDPNSERFGNTLSKAQVEALPDDPDEMEKQLQDMAGPGATIRVDGFRGGRLPPKSQIRSIRFASGMFAAENHTAGMTFVDITTQPGLGPMRGSLDFSFRDGSLNARNAFQPAKGPEQTQQYTLNLSGTLVQNRTSFSLSAGGASLYDSANIFAAVPGGSGLGQVRRPTDRLNLTARLDHALTRSHTLRASFQRSGNDQRSLGIGSFDLVDRGYTRTADESLFRVAENGPLTKSLFLDSRLQVRRSSTGLASDVEAPTVRVLDAFTSGGAQQSGDRRATEIEAASTLDWTRHTHAVKAGTLLEGGVYRSSTASNYLGTFTFASLDDYVAGRAATFSRLTGNPLVAYSQWQLGAFVQDDWRIRKNLTVSGGLREELQTHMEDGWNLSPRAGVTWSPFTNGKTTLRGGAGLFFDWLDADVFEQTLRVDGVRQQDLVVVNPSYPDVDVSSAAVVLPPGRYQLAPGLVMPRRTMVMGGISQQLTSAMGLNLTYTHGEGQDRFRGRNVNAPLDGVRPDPLLGNITEVESAGRSRSDTVMAGMNVNMPKQRTLIFANYAWIRQRNDADGPFALPADSYNPGAEWGPAAGVPSGVASAVVNTSLPGNIRIGVSTTARTAIPYNVTTGRDDNGDTVFTDRPEGTGRNTGRTAGSWDVAARFSYVFGFGQRPQAGAGAGGPQVVMIRPGGSAGDLLGGIPGGGADNKRLRIELFAAVGNLFNAVNPTGYSGVLTSPFFGRPTAAAAARKIDIGMKIGF